MTDVSLPFDADALRFPIDVSIPSDVRLIEHLVDCVVQCCATESVPPRHCSFNVPVALSEALSNAILYGNREDPSKAVRLSATVSERAVVFEVRDEGDGFDLDVCTGDPTQPESLTREDGRGLFLMQRLMDRVECFAADGNVVRLTLNRP